VGSSFQLVFAPIDEHFPDDAPLISSGFRVIPLDVKTVKHCQQHYLFPFFPCLGSRFISLSIMFIIILNMSLDLDQE
jgi:hypothetical protein